MDGVIAEGEEVAVAHTAAQGRDLRGRRTAMDWAPLPVTVNAMPPRATDGPGITGHKWAAIQFGQ